MRGRINAGPVGSVVESLESRQLLSGASLHGGILRVWGDAGAVNTISVANSADGLNVDVTINSVNRLGVNKPFSRSFAKSLGISSVWVRGGFLADTITASAVNGAFTLPMRVDGGAGNDVIRTGEGNDIVFAGAGNDTVDTDDGNDWIRGMIGDDVLDSGGGDDRVTGGVGNDTIDAGNDNDAVRGDAGNDNIEAGRGDDLVFGGVGDDTLYGEDGNDILWGGAGNDMIWGGRGNDTIGGVLGSNTLRGEDGIDTFVVRNLTLNPSNDYVAATDVLTLVTSSAEGGRPPAM